MMDPMSETDVYSELRPLLFSIAYRMLASVSEAEDIVQEAFLRYHRAVSEGADVQSPRAFLSTVTTRLAIDHCRSAQTRRETYIGEWLPEPLLTDVSAPADPARHAEDADSLSMAFLLVLERLSPVERAVFLLRDVFAYDFAEIAQIVGKSEANCRQLVVRARRHVVQDKPRFDTTREAQQELAARFFAVLGDGEMDDLVSLLAADVTVHGDSGGKSPSWGRTIVGRDHVGHLMLGLAEQLRQLHVEIRQTEINGQPGAMLFDPEGRLVNVFSLDIVDGQVQTIRSIINPDKLRHLGPLADVRGLLKRRGRT
jgi:RNA polymerase sigma-70 factor (ECF subfamily)